MMRPAQCVEAGCAIAACIIENLPKDTCSPETTEGKEGFIHPLSVESELDRATLKFIMRDFTTAGLKDKAAVLEGAVKAALAGFPRSSYKLTVSEQYRNMKEVLDRHPQVVDHAMEAVRRAMQERNATMFVRADRLAEANAFVDMRIDAVAACLDDLARLRSHGRFCVKEQLVTVRELLAGLGEAHSAHSTALLLRDRGVNAQFVDLTLWDQQDIYGVRSNVKGFKPTSEGNVRLADTEVSA